MCFPEMLKSRAQEAFELRGQLVEALKGMGAGDVAAEAVRKADKTARREEAAKEKERRAQKKLQREEDEPGANGALGPPEPQETPQEPETGQVELQQVLRVLLMLLEKGDTDTMQGFVDQLPPAVLVDVVLANIEALPTQQLPSASGSSFNQCKFDRPSLLCLQ